MNSRYLPRYSSPFKPSLRSTPQSSPYRATQTIPPPPPPPQQQDELLTTFRIRTRAHTVTLHGSWTLFTTPHRLTPDPRSRNLWKTNLPGLQMGATYWYYFVVDGRVVLDPTNPDVGSWEGVRGSVLFSPLLVQEDEALYEMPAAEVSRPSLSYSVESLEELEEEEVRWPLRMAGEGGKVCAAVEQKGSWGVGMGLNNEGAGLRKARSLRWMRERLEEEVGLRDEIGLELGWAAGVVG